MSYPTTWLERAAAGQTNAAVTLAVNASTGDDAPSADRPAFIPEGDYSSFPFETIQAAIDALPQNIIHQVDINVAAGSYPGFELRGRNASGNVFVRGTQEVFTPSTGPSSGTASSGTNRSITLTAAGWTTGDLEGKFVEITSGQGAGQHLIIADNDTDTIRTAGKFSPVPNNTSVFRITEPTSVLNSSGPVYPAGVWMTGCVGYMRVEDFHTTLTYGYATYQNQGTLALTRCTAAGGYYNFLSQEAAKTAFNQIGSLGATVHGIAFLNVPAAANAGFDKGWFSKNAGTDGIWAVSCLVFGVRGVWIKGCGNNGLSVTDGIGYFETITVDGCYDGIWASRANVYLENVEAKNSTARGISSDYGARIDLNTPVIGTGNGTWGVAIAGAGGMIVTQGLPTITGTSGDCTEDSSTVRTWSSDFASAGSYVHHDPRDNHILRWS